jgi:Domain of unknown function (DUF309)
MARQRIDRPGDPAVARDPAPASGSRVVPETDSGSPGLDTGTIRQGDRRKAYRPLALAARQAAARSAVEAYERDDWFLAHELLEPAWMGTADIAERELYQGLIKLAAAHVHGVRGNPAGIRKNLAGAQAHLALAFDGGDGAELSPGAAAAAADLGLDVADLLAAIDATLATLEGPPTVEGEAEGQREEATARRAAADRLAKPPPIRLPRVLDRSPSRRPV